MEVCTNPDILFIINILLTAVDIIKIVIPIILILVGTIDLAKCVINNDESAQKKSVNIFVKRFIYAALVFTVPWMVEVVLIWAGNTFSAEINYTDCLENVNKIDYYRELANAKKEEAAQKQDANKTKLDTLNQKEDDVLISNEKKNDSTTNNEADKDSNNTTGVEEGIFIGQKYKLTDKQLRGIARLCQQEQGNVVGAAAEASLMANRFELFGSKYGYGGDGLYSYVANSGWFSNAKEHMKKTSSLKNDIYTAVYEVLVLGKRTLPLYVDEHDCIDCGKYGFDVIKIVTGGTVITNQDKLKDHKNYVQNDTVIYNKYKSVYTFYTFPTKSSDPFGYTKDAKDKYDKLMGK